MALAHGLPPPPRPKIGRPRKKRAVEDTALGSKRNAKSKAWHSLVLVDYAVLLEKAAAEEEAAAEEALAERLEAERAEAEHEAVGAAVEELVEAVEQAEARRLQLERRLAREIAPGRDFIDEARARPSARNENACFICMNSDEATDSYMPCCRHHVHRACILRWHGMGQNKTKHQIKAPKQDGGWKPVDMARLHQCPNCSAEMLSARVPRLCN